MRLIWFANRRTCSNSILGERNRRNPQLHNKISNASTKEDCQRVCAEALFKQLQKADADG